MEAKHTTQYFDFTDTEHKHFFAGLLNSALHNFNQALTELRRRINVKDQINKGFIKIAFRNDISESDWENRINYLSESLVFVKHLKFEKRCEFRDKLVLLYETIDALRNYYTHYKRGKTPINTETFKILDELLLISALEVKRNRAKSEEYKAFLSTKYNDEFNEIVEKAELKFKEHNANLRKGVRKRAFKSQEEKVNYVLNSITGKFLYRNDKNEEVLSKNAKSKNEETDEFSIYGFVLLLALFLNKKQTVSLLSYTKYLKDTRKLKFVINRWTLTYLCFKDIKKSIKSDYSEDSLLLQMVSELNKCPNEIYQHLTPEKKQEFIEDVNEYYQDHENFEGNSEEALVSHEVIQKRYGNKFPYFAIRFLDEVIDFPSLTFQVNLGKFKHDTSKKTFSNKIETDRRILDKITVFTKLSIATNNKKEYIKNSENLNEDNAWLEFPMPSYQFEKNNIGIWLNMNDDSGKSDAPEIRESGKQSKFAIANELGLRDAVKKPVAFLSFNELPALIYEFLINKKTPKEVEQIIRSKIIEQKKLISAYDSTKAGNKKILPKKLLLSKKHSVLDVKKLKENINTEIKKDPLGEIRKSYKNPVKKEGELNNSEKGKIASWLTDDIKRFTSKNTKEDWKGYQYSEFQALFAFYDSKKKTLINFLENDLKFNYKIDNPTDGINFKYNTLYDFYNNYLKNRRGYLNNWLTTIKSNEENIPEAIFTGFTKRLYEIKPLDIQQQTFLKKIPINLPKGIFDNKPTVYNRKEHKDTLLADWFTASSNLSTSQKYYRFDKVYKYFIEKKIWNKRTRNNTTEPIKRNQKLIPTIGLKEQYNNDLPKKYQIDIYKNEKSIRKIMREDFYLLEMVKSLFGYDNTENIQLMDVFLTKRDKEEIKKVSKKQSAKPKGDKTGKVVNDSYLLSREITVSTLDNKIVDVVKIKDIGKFRKLELDERVNQLVEYFPEKSSWSAIEINDQIDDYEKVRKFELFKSVHILEELIYEDAKKNNSLHELLNNGKPNFKKYLSYFFLENDRESFNNINLEKVSINDDSIQPEWYKIYLLASIRNRFSHNQLLPIEDFDYLKNIIPVKKDERVGTYLNRAFNALQ